MTEQRAAGTLTVGTRVLILEGVHMGERGTVIRCYPTVPSYMVDLDSCICDHTYRGCEVQRLTADGLACERKERA